MLAAIRMFVGASFGIGQPAWLGEISEARATVCDRHFVICRFQKMPVVLSIPCGELLESTLGVRIGRASSGDALRITHGVGRGGLP